MIRAFICWVKSRLFAPNPETYDGEFQDVMAKGKVVAGMRENSISRAMKERGPNENY